MEHNDKYFFHNQEGAETRTKKLNYLLGSVASGIAGVPEAPIDGLPYARANGGWIHFDTSGAGDMLKGIYDTNDNGIVDNSEKVNGYTVETAVPLGALFTDTVYDDSSLVTLIETKLDVLDYATQIEVDTGTATEKIVSPLTLDAKTFKLIKFSITEDNPTYQEGLVFWDKVKKTLSMYTEFSDVTLSLPFEQVRKIVNRTGITILDGQPIRHNGVDAITELVSGVLAQANTFTNARVLGVATHDILNDTTGLITYGGDVEGVNMEAVAQSGTTLTNGSPIYVSATEAGKYTNVPPQIRTTVGGFLTGVSGISLGNMGIDIENTISLPNAHSSIGSSTDATITVTTGFQKFVNLSGKRERGILIDEALGTFTALFNGDYMLTTMVALSGIIGSNSAEELDVEVFKNGSPIGNPFPLIVGRNGTRTAGTPFEVFTLVTGDVIDFRYSSQTIDGQTINLDILSMIMQSSEIDF